MVKNHTISNSVLANLEDLIHAFAGSLSIDETLETVLNRLLEYLHTEAASVFLCNESASEFVCHACVGPVDLMGIKIKLGSGIVGRAVAESKVQLIRDTYEDKNFYSEVDKQTGFNTRSILCAPLVVQNVTLGAIEIINKIPSPDNPEGLFDETDMQLLTILASSAALAIRNASMAVEMVKNETLHRELQIARTIQESFLPVFNAQHPIIGLNRSAKEVSGDFFDYLLLPNGNYLFNIGDVSGKGIEAALLMAKGSSLYHYYDRRNL
jgi:phosphoserine phosphatase RsbU/P